MHFPRQFRELPVRELPVIVMLLFLSAGCGKDTGPRRIEVNGKVTYNSKPIMDGEISFVPEGDQGSPATSAVIKDGSYRISADFGVTAGTYLVKINAYQPAADQKPVLSPGGLDRPPTPGGFRDQILPEKFNTKSTIEKISVAPGDQKLEKNFDLKE